jgi:localization factor PodJL
MLDRVSRSESETAEVYRRIEEQLRGMARRLDASERSQTESNRVMSKAAVEMNITAREQAEAFDQLGAHVTNIGQRLDRVEARDSGDVMREAVKALHQGLSRLADQISQTASQSASQISALANNLETVAGRVAQARHESLEATQALGTRLGEVDGRVVTLEKTSQTTTGTLDRVIEAIEAQERDKAPADVIGRLEDSVHRLEERGPDPSLDRRLAGIERALSDVVARIEPETDNGIEDSLNKMVRRLEVLEEAQRDTADAVRHINSTKTKSAEEPPPAPISPSAPVAASVAPQPVVDAPPFIEPVSAPPPVATVAPPPFAPPPAFAAPESPPAAFAIPEPPPASFASAEPLIADSPFVEPSTPFEPTSEQTYTSTAPKSATPTVESYLAAARRSARVAAQAEAQRASSIGSLRWTPKPEEKAPKRTRPLLVGLVALIGIAVIAAAVLNRQTVSDVINPNPQAAVQKPAPVKHVRTAKKVPAAAVTPAAGTVQTPAAQPAATPAAPPVTQTAPAAVPAAQTAPTAPLPLKPTEAKAAAPSAPAPQVNKTAVATKAATPVAITKVTTPPPQQQPATRPAPAPTQVATLRIPTAPIDKLTAAATTGNARAQLIVGLKYLDGDGVPANEMEAARWLSRAAEAGEPVAQYRLGTLYERGRGVGADAAKAVRWYQAAANQGSRKAMHNLAVAYAEGAGVKKDFTEASRWFLRAAALGLSDSQFNLAVLYERGLGVPQNLVDAYKWYAIAAAQGDQESKTRLTTIASQLNSEERAAAQHAADIFRPGQLDAHANVPPSVADATRG